MKRSLTTRLVTGASAALLAATGVTAGGAANAATTTQADFSYSQGWRVDRHVRALGDVNGDGRMDVVGFGDAGVYVSLGQADGRLGASALRLADYGYNQGWRNSMHPRHVADVDGDKRADLVGFGNAGVWVSYGAADGSFTAPSLKVREFGYSQGWRVDQHPRHLADLVGDGAADIVGFGYSGVYISHGQSSRNFVGTGKRIDSYGYNRGWRVGDHPRMLGDVDGNKTADIVGFGDAGAYVSYFSQAGDTFTAAELEVPNFGYAQGWRGAQYPRYVTDANGDGKADIIGYGYSGVSAAYSQGMSFTPVAVKSNNFGFQQGWRSDMHLRTHADINGDTRHDLVGFGHAGVYVAYGQAGNTFGAPFLHADAYGHSDGWTEALFPRVLGDVNGDHKEDIVAFGYSLTYVETSP